MGASVWEAVLCLLGYRSSLSFPERSYGKTEQDSDHCSHLVCALSFNFLIIVG
ncbi:unnamed protein product [Linum tenue]|uniref:Uncharacterized protein n=1 Tax=Linum tenue TaxID=586396 RepID=A0AAV0IDB0_9ROSI|nr:unnamed protein product [Linum tenue]